MPKQELKQELSNTAYNEIFRSVFDWPSCAHCKNAGSCRSLECPWMKKKELDQYLKFFLKSSRGSRPKDLLEPRPSLRNHKDLLDLLDIIQMIKAYPDRPKAGLMLDFFHKYDYTPSKHEQNRAFDLAITVLTMMRCSDKVFPTLNLHSFPETLVWQDKQTAFEFARCAIPCNPTKDPTFPYQDFPDLSASTLNREGLVLQGTDDLRRHLLYHPDTRTVEIFPHVSYLKECLENQKLECPTNSLLLPRRLLEETLFTLQVVLFPLGDTRSQLVLSTEGFDGMSRSAFGALRLYDFNMNGLGYWSSRLQKLARVVETGRPPNTCQKWLTYPYKMNLMILSIMLLTMLFTVVTMLLEIPGLGKAKM